MSGSPADCCEKLISTITQSLPIPEVIKHIKNAFRERHLADVQNILRENEMKKEICLLKLKLEENQRKCEDLEEEKRALKINELQMVNEKDKLILELNGKIIELKSKNLVNERLLGVYRDNNKCLNTGIVEDLVLKQIEAEKAVEKLKSENLEAKKIIDELRLKKLESDKLAEMFKRRLKNLSPRISKIEKGFADIFTVKIGGENDGSGNRSSSGLSKKVAHASGARLMTAEGYFSKTARSSYAADGDIIEIIDCDDETNPGGAPDISKGGVGSNVGEKEMNFVRCSSSSQRNKRNRTNCDSDDSCTYSDSDDDSCTDSRMDDLIASLRRKSKIAS